MGLFYNICFLFLNYLERNEILNLIGNRLEVGYLESDVANLLIKQIERMVFSVVSFVGFRDSWKVEFKLRLWMFCWCSLGFNSGLCGFKFTYLFFYFGGFLSVWL